MRGPDYEVSLEPEEMKKLVEGVRALELARGTGEKQLLEEEKVVRDWAHHSIVSTENINSGDVLSEKNLYVKRPGNGIPAEEFKNVIGKVAKNNIKKDSQLSYDDF